MGYVPLALLGKRFMKREHNNPEVHSGSVQLICIIHSYGAFQNIKVRFVGTVDPGDTIITEMWKEKQRVLFQCKVKESGKLVIGAAAAELVC